MLAKVGTVISMIEALAPPTIALPGDPVGLQLGHPAAEVSAVMVALDADGEALAEARSLGAGMIVTHHPLIYQKLGVIDETRPAGELIAACIRSRVSVYCAHSSYDAAPRGVSYRLAEALGFPLENAGVLEVTGSEQLMKLVVFVPVGHEDRIRQALAEAGAGKIGRYSHCMFQTAGMGTFMGEEGTAPFIGIGGRLEKVDEIRLETILPATLRTAVVQALLDAHPYEEAAYDLYPLDLEGRAIGLGLVIELPEEISVREAAGLCKERLGLSDLRLDSAGRGAAKRVALCGGSGGSLIEAASLKGAGLLISADFRYHDLQLARALGLSLVDAGHDTTEMPAVRYLARYLEEKLGGNGYETKVYLHAPTRRGWSR